MAQKTQPGTQKIETRPLPALKAVEDKGKEGARPDEFDSRERDLLAHKAFVEDEARIAEAIAKEKPVEVPLVTKSYGALAESPQKFVVVHEDLGTQDGRRFRRGDEVSIRDLCIFDVEPAGNGLYKPNFLKPRVGAARANIDRLINLGAIRPLVAFA